MLQEELMKVGQQYACMLYTWRSCSMPIGQVNTQCMSVYSADAKFWLSSAVTFHNTAVSRSAAAEIW